MVGVRPGKGEQHEGIGDMLRRARERHKLSLQDVSNQLHIPVRQLEGLEHEDYSVFSAELYARGAYAAYAKYLGIDTHMSARAFLRSLSNVRQRIPLKLHTPETFFERLIHPRIILGASILVLALGVGAYIFWQIQSFWRLPNLVISGPSSFTTSEHAMTVSGTTEEGAQLRVNGEPVLLQDHAMFSVSLELRPGINPVRVEVTNAAGRTRVKQLSLLRSS